MSFSASAFQRFEGFRGVVQPIVGFLGGVYSGVGYMDLCRLVFWSGYGKGSNRELGGIYEGSVSDFYDGNPKP